MRTFFQLAATAVALLGSASLAAAQDTRSRGETWRYNGYGNGNAYGTMPTGRYYEPRRLRQQPLQRIVPFTWEEKRHFDISNGEQG